MTAQNNRRVKQLRRISGILLFAAALLYLSNTASKHFDSLTTLIGSDPMLWASIAALAPVYAGSLFLLGLCWLLFLPEAGKFAESQARLHIYAVTSAAKYFPGGFLHFGGRQVLGVRRGLAHSSLLFASVHETVACAGSALVIGGLFYWAQSIQHAITTFIFLSAILVLGAIKIRKMKRAFFAYVLAGAFMVIMGGIAIGCANILRITGEPALVGGAYLIAWCVGFISPGVSAGIGVREAALVFILSGHAAPAEATALAIIMRFVTTTGDGLFFLASGALKPAGESWKANN